ncbi:MAG: crossover junction endodeoxyribonuclease RuvC [Candidatus Brocadiia bacterium]|jgi:Holliday junction resolvasome RuvABC endonuclease subunit
MKQWHEPQLVAYEFTPRGASTNAMLIHFGLVTRLEEWAYRMEARTAFIYPSQLKKLVTGRGDAEKEEVRDVMRKRWKIPKLTSLDESDAVAVLTWALRKA